MLLSLANNDLNLEYKINTVKTTLKTDMGFDEIDYQLLIFWTYLNRSYKGT